MRLTTLLLLAIAGFAAFKVIRKPPAAPETTVQVDPAQMEAWRQDSIRYAEREERRRVERLREDRNTALRRAMAAPPATFQPENRIGQLPASTERQQKEEELAACSALPQYGPHGHIVGYTSNPDCAEYRRRHPR